MDLNDASRPQQVAIKVGEKAKTKEEVAASTKKILKAMKAASDAGIPMGLEENAEFDAMKPDYESIGRVKSKTCPPHLRPGVFV